MEKKYGHKEQETKHLVSIRKVGKKYYGLELYTERYCLMGWIEKKST